MYGKFILFLVTHWPESSALDNTADFCLAILRMTLPPKNFCLKLPNSVRNAKIILKAMPLAMLPTKCLQHWPESSGLGNVVDFWLATLPMALPPKKFLHFSLN